MLGYISQPLHCYLNQPIYIIPCDPGHSTIAELMILANGSVARLLHRHMPSAALLRSHGAASLDKLQEIRDLGASMGLKVFDSSSTTTGGSTTGGSDITTSSGSSDITSSSDSSGDSSSVDGPHTNDLLISRAHLDVQAAAHQQLLQFKG